MECVYCGKKIETSDKRVHYCSKDCKLKSYRKKQRLANKKRRETNADYREFTYAINRRRYHIKKHLRYIELANEILNNKWDVDSLSQFLENNFRLRH